MFKEKIGLKNVMLGISEEADEVMHILHKIYRLKVDEHNVPIDVDESGIIGKLIEEITDVYNYLGDLNFGKYIPEVDDRPLRSDFILHIANDTLRSRTIIALMDSFNNLSFAAFNEFLAINKLLEEDKGFDEFVMNSYIKGKCDEVFEDIVKSVGITLSVLSLGYDPEVAEQKQKRFLERWEKRNENN